MKAQKGSLAGVLDLAVDTAQAPKKSTQTAPASRASDADDTRPVGTIFRMQPADYKRIRRFAEDRGVSIQELLEQGVNALLESQGLKAIHGIPRTRRRRRV